MTQAESAAADLYTDARQEAAGPLAASWATRVLYCLALIASLISLVKPVWSWIALAMGQGLLAMAGPSLYFVLAAAISYRIYEVLRYPAALQAKPPDLAGWLLRGLAWVVMAAGVVGMVGMFVIPPLTPMMVGNSRDAGMGLFVLGVYASTLASVGWVGCLMLEISRMVGVPAEDDTPGRTARERAQDYAVMAGVAVMATAVPLALTLLHGTPCYGPTLGQCAAKVEGGVSRMVAAPVGAPVALESNIDEIEYRHPSGRAWVLHERPDLSLVKSGHPVAHGAHAGPKVSIEAVPAGKGVIVVLTVSERGEPTARFTTRFESRARLEQSGGVRKLVVELARNVQRPVLTNSDGFLDELYQQMRLAIGSEREVAEAAARVQATAEPAGTEEVPESLRPADARPAKNCEGVLRLGRGQAERDFVPSAGSYLPEAFFVTRDPAPTVLLYRNDRVSCHDGAVWIAAPQPPGRTLHIRKYDMAAALQRHLLVSLPPRAQRQSEVVDPASFAERGDLIEFAVIVQDGKDRWLERFKVKL